jgi:hypothetical protein
MASGKGMHESATEEQATTLNEKDAESYNLLRKSSSFFRSKLKKFKTAKSMDNLRKQRFHDEDMPGLPSPPEEITKGKFSLDAARSFRLSALPQHKKNSHGRVLAQEAVAPVVPSPPSADEPLQGNYQLTTVPSRLPSTVSENTTIAIPQYGAANAAVVPQATTTNVTQAPIITNYPPKPLKYSPVEAAEQEDEVKAMDFQRLKRHSSTKRISLPAVMMRHRSVSQAVTIDNSALDMAEVAKAAERRKSDANMVPMSGTFGRRAKLLQSYMSGGLDKTFHRRSFAWSDLSDH